MDLGLVSGIFKFVPTAKCRHCAAPIKELPSGAWMTEDGFMVCVKAPIDTLTSPGFGGVTHQPMPDGLDGAPQ